MIAPVAQSVLEGMAHCKPQMSCWPRRQTPAVVLVMQRSVYFAMGGQEFSVDEQGQRFCQLLGNVLTDRYVLRTYSSLSLAS